MKSHYEQIANQEIERADAGTRLQNYITILRSILQTACVVGLELQYHLDHKAVDESPDKIAAIHKPTDGTPIHIINRVVPSIRSQKWPNFCKGWFNDNNRKTGNLSGRLQEWVEFRNRHPGHGVLDETTKKEWIPKCEKLIFDSLEILGELLPKSGEGENLYIDTPKNHRVNISTPFYSKKIPIVVREIKKRKEVWSLYAQSLEFSTTENIVEQLEPTSPLVLIEDEIATSRYKNYDVFDSRSNLCAVLSNSPPRQATVFRARVQELEKLSEWIADEDSLACLVFGDGGIGKTTLVLEFLYKVLHSEIVIENKLPEIICFYSAKEQKWTEYGLVPIANASDALEDALRELVMVVHDSLDQSWFKKEADALISRVEKEMNDLGLKRNHILLVLDNTETFAKSREAETALASRVRLISRRVGRVLLTSRRREMIEATPIHVGTLSDAGGVELLRALSVEFGAKPLQQAGYASLRKLSEQLGGKPLLIDIIARYIGRTQSGIDEAIDVVNRRSEEGLAEFLYEDAWHRMGESQRMVFLILLNAGVPINSELVGWACREAGALRTDWEESFEETRFGTIMDLGNDYEIELTEFAGAFIRQQYRVLNDQDKQHVDSSVEVVSHQLALADNIRRAYLKDRVPEAFRTVEAKAAKVEASRGNNSDADIHYELALAEDPTNGLLMDRYAFFLLNNLKDPDRALTQSKSALEEEPKNPDVNLTLGLIYYRLNDLKKGDKYVDQSVKFGKPVGLGLLRKGIARYHESVRFGYTKSSLLILNEALKFVRRAKQESRPDNDPFYRKNVGIASHYEERILRRFNNFRLSEDN